MAPQLDYDYDGIKTSDLFTVKGKVALVTGGSSGLGLNIAHGLAANGAKVYISSRKQAQCDAAVAEIKRSYPGAEAVAVACDASSAANLVKLAAFIGEKEPGGVDFCVANAGATWGSPIDKHPESAFSKVMDLNVKGVFYTIQAMLPLLQKAGKRGDPARVIVTGSVAGLKTNPTEVISYSASKVAVHALVHNLAPDLGRRNITINAIAPGLFPSKMTAYRFSDGGKESKNDSARANPLGRHGEAKDIIALSLYILSKGANFLNGSVINLDGGNYLDPSKGDAVFDKPKL
ncbi:hypothetical protein PYCC9005_001716 [Savitreella phatthalungensis]